MTSSCPGCPSDPPLRQALAQLAPALKGFPVDELMDVYMSAEQPDRAHAYQMVDCCLAHWIASLDATLGTYPADSIDEFAHVRSRQCSARDALMRLREIGGRLQS